MQQFMKTILTGSSALALAGLALIGQARAADLGPYGAAAPIDTWTGFSVGVGGGIGILNGDLKTNAARTDTIGVCILDCGFTLDLLDINQDYASTLDDLGGTGGFFTVQGAYDYQFAPRWVVGAFVDADWSNIGGSSKQSSSASLTLLPGSIPGDLPEEIPEEILDGIGGFNVPLGAATIKSEITTDWSISVGGRLGWLASPSTLLYVVGAYTHQELSTAQVKVSIADPLKPLGELGLDINSPTSLLVKLPDSLDGFSLGGGGEVKVGGPWTLKLEYRWTHLEGSAAKASSKKDQCCVGFELIGLYRNVESTASADLDLDIHTVRGAVTYHFWSGGRG